MTKFAIYNSDNFPKVTVQFSNHILNDEDYDNFEKDWLDLYHRESNFYFIFDMVNIGFIPMKYVYKLTKFIEKIKNLDKNYLLFSIIIVNNWYIQHLFNITFMIQSPVSNVILINKNDSIDIHNLEKDILNHRIINHPNIICFFPKL